MAPFCWTITRLVLTLSLIGCTFGTISGPAGPDAGDQDGIQSDGDAGSQEDATGDSGSDGDGVSFDHDVANDGGPAASDESGGSGPEGVDPSGGSGGDIQPGDTGTWDCAFGSGKVKVRIPASYDGTSLASPVVWLLNEPLSEWQAVADSQAVIIVDLDEYNDVDAYAAKLNFALPKLQAEYSVDRARHHLAGWSAGGNIAVWLGCMNQDVFASTLVFPGTGGQTAYDELLSWTGHKIRLYYACGDADPNYDWQVVQNEASVFAGLGYNTRFDKVAGASHQIPEATYGKRQEAWTWVRDFNLLN